MRFLSISDKYWDMSKPRTISAHGSQADDTDDTDSKLKFLHKYPPELQETIKKNIDQAVSKHLKQKMKRPRKVEATDLDAHGENPLKKQRKKKLTRKALMKRNQVTNVNPRYPFSNRGATQEVITSSYESSKSHLMSLGIPCDELHLYPDIQYMTKDEIQMCLDRLKLEGFQVIFSLFLIQRINDEIEDDKKTLADGIGRFVYIICS